MWPSCVDGRHAGVQPHAQHHRHVQVARGTFILFFNEVFDAMFRWGGWVGGGRQGEDMQMSAHDPWPTSVALWCCTTRPHYSAHTHACLPRLQAVR